MPTIVTNCSNNYGPYQFPEKLIPLFINNIRHRKPLPVYGKGENVRDWLYVEDHARAIDLIFHEGKTADTYNIGGFNEWKNIDIIKVVIKTVDRLLGRKEGEDMDLITYVTDRKGHDMRYAIDSRKLQRELGWEPIRLQSKEGLALLNGTQFMSAHGIWAVIKCERLSEWADRIAAMSLDAFDGRIEPFYPQVHAVRPHKGQADTAARILELLDGSEIISRKKEHVQDPYSFRCIPQVHGAVKDTLRYVKSVLETEINSATDNPTVFPDEDLIISAGNFHGEPIALPLDFLAIAMSELASISERRIYRLISGQRELPSFLVANPGLNSGFMIPQYTAASIVSQNKGLCTPASVDSIPSSQGQEDHVSMGANAATKLVRVINNTERVLAIELMNAAQALEFRRPLRSSWTIEKIFAHYRKEVPFISDDQYMHPLIEKTIRFLREYNLVPFNL